jgi:hypothetical protein
MKRVIVGIMLGLCAVGCASTSENPNRAAQHAIRTYQDRVAPGGNLTSQNVALAALGINTPTLDSAPTLARPLTTGAGAPPMAEIFRGVGTAIRPASPAIPRADEFSRVAPMTTQTDILTSAIHDLPARVRQALMTGRPESITRLTPDRVERFEIDALNGQVTLRGYARSETERLMIGNRIATMEGVRSVNNQLRVISPTRPGMPDPAVPATALQSED